MGRQEFFSSLLGQPHRSHEREELVSVLKSCVGQIIDKYDTPGIVLNGAVLLSLLVTKRIFISEEIDMPDLNSIIDAPNSDEAKHAASFVRANALTEFGMREIEPTWAKYFWNHSLQLSACEFVGDGVAND